MAKIGPGAEALNSIFHDCRQCGACCKKYRKILLQHDEAAFIRKMGGHVGVDVGLNELRDNSLEELIARERGKDRVYMIHPDDKGCIFLEKRNGKYFCKIYHYRPRSCQGFKCNIADTTFNDIFGEDSILLLGKDRFGLPFK